MAAIEQQIRPQTTAAPRRVVIVGGGISGLSAAWSLQKQAQGQGVRLHITVLESADRWGGKILTEQVAGPDGQPFVVEAGPDSFLTQKPWALELARELGLDGRLLGTNDKQRHVYVLHRGRPVKLPDGVLLIVPTKFLPFALSPLISPLGKLRMGLELFIPRKRDGEDETLAAFVQRRLGHEALDKIAEPLMSGIYNAEADRQSILATFPRFRQIERDHGSLIRGMVAARRRSATPPRLAGPQAGAPRISAFMSLQPGTQHLVDALLPRLDAELRLNTRVIEITRARTGGWRVTTADHETLAADALLVTTPAWNAADLLRPLAPAAADRLAAIRYVSTGTISLAWRATDLKRPLLGHGLVVPKSEQRPINAVTISSSKFDGRAPAGHVLLRVFFGGSRSPASMALNDDEILDMVRAELRTLLGIEAAPLFHRIYRWHNANPQYDVNHLDQVAAIEAALPPGLFLAGSALRGVGVPDCIHQSEQTATQLFQHLRHLQHQESAA